MLRTLFFLFSFLTLSVPFFADEEKSVEQEKHMEKEELNEQIAEAKTPSTTIDVPNMVFLEGEKPYPINIDLYGRAIDQEITFKGIKPLKEKKNKEGEEGKEKRSGFEMGGQFYVGGGKVIFDQITFHGLGTRGESGASGKKPTIGTAGCGGALHVAKGAEVVLIDPVFANCSASGGAGGNRSKKDPKDPKNPEPEENKKKKLDHPSTARTRGPDPIKAEGVNGGGAGLGGAIYLASEAKATIIGTPTFQNNIVSGGLGGALDVKKIGKNKKFGENGSGIGQDIFMNDKAQLTLHSDANWILANPIGGFAKTLGRASKAGGVTKTGRGKITLLGEQLFTGTLRVEEGEVALIGSTSANIHVGPNGDLRGQFAMLNPKRQEEHFISSPETWGSFILEGTQTVKEQIILEDVLYNINKGTLVFDFTPDGIAKNSTKIKMKEGAIVGDAKTPTICVNRGNYLKGREITLFSINGTPVNPFDEFIVRGEFADRVNIVYDAKKQCFVITNTVLFEHQALKGHVATTIADVMRKLSIEDADSELGYLLETLGTLDDTALNNSLKSLSPVRFGSLEWINVRNNSYVASLIAQHKFQLCCSPRREVGCNVCDCECNPWYDPCACTSVWVAPFANLQLMYKTLDYLPPFRANAYGLILGIDHCPLESDFYVGLAFAYTHTDLKWKGNGGKGNINSYTGSIYGSYQGSCLCIDFSILGGGSDHSLKRKVILGDKDLTAKSDPWGYFLTGHLGLQYGFDCNCWTFAPYALADYHYFQRDSFKEKDAGGANLRVSSIDQNFVRGEAGLRVYYSVDLGDSCYAPYLALAWVGDFPLETSIQKARFVGQSEIIKAKSYNSAVHLAAPKVGIKWTHCNGFSFILGYEGLFNSSTSINEGEIRLEKVF